MPGLVDNHHPLVSENLVFSGAASASASETDPSSAAASFVYSRLCRCVDASEGDSLSVHSSHSGGMMLEDDVDSRSMVSYVSGTSLGTMHSSQSAGSRSHAKSSAASKESTTLLSCHSAKASYGLSKHRLPPQVSYSRNRFEFSDYMN